MSQIEGEGEPEAQSMPQSQEALKKGSDETEPVTEEQEVVEEVKPPLDDPMEEDDQISSATVFTIRLRQSRSNLQHKMSVPELCRNFRSGKLHSLVQLLKNPYCYLVMDSNLFYQLPHFHLIPIFSMNNVLDMCYAVCFFCVLTIHSLRA